MRKRTLDTITWLDYYCLMRSQVGIAKSVTFMYDGNDAVLAAVESMQVEAQGKNVKARAVGDAVGGAIIAVGTALSAVPIAGAIVAAAGALIKILVRLFTIECDKYRCLKPKSYYRRSLIGINPPPGSTLNTKKGRSYWVGNRGAYQRYLHDGLATNGFGEMGTPQELGRTIGVNSPLRVKTRSRRRRRRIAKISKYWKKSSSNPKLSDAKWKRRAGRVRWILGWMQNKIQCRTLKCGQDVLRGTKGKKKVKEGGKRFGADFGARRQRGSRWYASVVQMMSDSWAILGAMGNRNAVRFLKSQRLSKAAEIYKARRGSKPFPWATCMSHVSWDALRGLLKNGSKILETSGTDAQKAVVDRPAVSGQRAREKAERHPERRPRVSTTSIPIQQRPEEVEAARTATRRRRRTRTRPPTRRRPRARARPTTRPRPRPRARIRPMPGAPPPAAAPTPTRAPEPERGDNTMLLVGGAAIAGIYLLTRKPQPTRSE